MEDSQVKPFIEKIIAYFQSKENYEACSVIRNVYEKWIAFKISKKAPKASRSKSSKSAKKTEEGNTESSK